MTYWRYWQLEGPPFTADSILFRGATVEEALARIEFLIGNRRSVGSLIGPSGVGKSSLLRYCATHPPAGIDIPRLQMFRVSMLGMSPGELLSDLATRLSGNRRLQNAQAAWKTLCDYFQAACREDTRTVLLVDDTESCSPAAETDLSRLLAMSFPMTLIFAVESQLASTVSRNLFDRCDLQIELHGWDIEQTSQFLAWMFARQGRTSPIFTDSGVERLQQMSQGIARRIVQLTDLALVAGAVSQVDVIDAECVEQVAGELPKTSAA